MHKRKLQDLLQELALQRTRQGISLEQIADETKISVRYLRAIENGNLEDLPEGVYRASYLQQYAERIEEGISARLTSLSRGLEEACAPVVQPVWGQGWRSRVLRVMTACLGLCLSGVLVQAEDGAAKQPDPRFTSLSKFFHQQGCPLERWVTEFLQVADKHNLDWRLLPSMAMVESGGGKNAKNQNVLGWRSSKGRFNSVTESIEHVASRLAHSPLYAGKNVQQKLRTYNPRHPEYAGRVLAYMNQLQFGPS